MSRRSGLSFRWTRNGYVVRDRDQRTLGRVTLDAGVPVFEPDPGCRLLIAEELRDVLAQMAVLQGLSGPGDFRGSVPAGSTGE